MSARGMGMAVALVLALALAIQFALFWRSESLEKSSYVRKIEEGHSDNWPRLLNSWQLLAYRAS